MDSSTLSQFENKLKFHRDALLEWYQAGQGNGGMRHDELTELQRVIAAHEEALQRIETGAFGRCEKCTDGGDVEHERLELDFTTSVCLSHYSEPQIRALEHDLELAAKVHRQLLPAAVPSLPGVQVAAFTESARIVGGDYFDFYPDSAGGQGVVVADVMGKGLPASMLVPNLQASLRILGPEYERPHELAGRLNGLFRYNLKLIRFISLFLASFDPARRLFQYCNAGHNAPILWDAVRREPAWLPTTGPAIGLTHAPIFKTSERTMNRGDLVLLYTDGIVEGTGPSKEPFGEEALANYTRSHAAGSAKDFVKGLVEEFKTFTGHPLEDDVTLVAIKFD